VDCYDKNGTLIQKGQNVKVQIQCGEWKTGVVIQTDKRLITIRHGVIDDNPDGVLFSAEPNKTVMLD